MIKTTNNDIVLCAHGALDGKKTFDLPEGYELCLTQPLGATLNSFVMQALIQGIALDKLVLSAGRAKPPLDAGKMTAVFTKKAPDLEMSPLGDQYKDVTGYINGIKNASKAPWTYRLGLKDKPMMLSQLLAIKEKEHPFMANSLSRRLTLPKKNLRLYWGACTGNDDDDARPTVYPNALGLHKFVVAYAKSSKDKLEIATKKGGKDMIPLDKLIEALKKAMAIYTKNPLDTAGVLAELDKVSKDLCGKGGACELSDPEPQIMK